LRPKMGRRESERLYKGRNPRSWGTLPPTNLQLPEPRFSLPHRSHLHRGGLPWSHEGRGLRGGAPHDAGGGGVPRAVASAVVAVRTPRCSSPPSSPLSPSPTPPII
jgi:hypothetical protein